jgi:hypothetical protein
MRQRLNAQFYALITKLECEDEKLHLVRLASEQRTASVAELTDRELRCLIGELLAREERECKAMRGKVIHLMCLLGYVNGSGNADFMAINASIAAIGTNNPRKAELFGLRKSELRAVLNQVEMRYKNGLRKSTKS